MNLEHPMPSEAEFHHSQRIITAWVSVFTAVCGYVTVPRALRGVITWPLIGLQLVLLYGLCLAVQGWRRKQPMPSCAALLVVPGMLLAACLLKFT